MNKKSFIVGVVATSLLLTSQVLAHAVVKPNTVGVGKFQSFTLSIPSEKPIATVGVRLVLPNDLNFVTPNVKSGWKINIKKETTGKNITDDDGMPTAEEKTTEINWTKGNIPAGMRDEFVFSVQVPSQPTTLNWKVYQTYADSSVVSWDQDPNNLPKEEAENTGPYSKTEVVDDLTVVPNSKNSVDTKHLATISLSALSLIISLIALKKSKRASIN